jgi:hypothetical protein
MTSDQQLAFNHLHIDQIAQDPRFRNWEYLTEDQRLKIIDIAEKKAELFLY